MGFFFGLIIGLLIAFVVRRVDVNYLIEKADSDTPVRIRNKFYFIKSEDKTKQKRYFNKLEALE
ncbi:hypothetical protein COK46_01590 [Bacillus thuringiensis]|nr:hypothetical protein COK46_01590 [Bacillus thuringiensis]